MKEGYTNLRDSDDQAQEDTELLKKEDQIDPANASFMTMYKYAEGYDYVITILGLISTSVFSLTPIYIILAIGEILNKLEDDEDTGRDFYEDMREIAFKCYICSIIALVTCWFAVITFVKVGNRQGMMWRKIYSKVLLNKPIQWFDENNPSEMGSSVDSDCNAIEHGCGEKVMILFSTVLFFLGSVVIGFFLNLELALLSLVQLPFHAYSGYLVDRATVKAGIERQEKYKVAGGIAEESFEGIKTVASCNAQESRARKYQAELEPLRKTDTLMGLVSGFGWGLFFWSYFFYAGVQFYIAAYIMEDNPDVWGRETNCSAKESFIIFTASSMASVYLSMTIPCIQVINNGALAATKLDNIISTSRKFDGNQKISNVRGHIEFDNVCFSYSSNPNTKILNGVSFTVEPGDSLAIVGETGSGKSTVIQLIEGFYYCTDGAVKIDGIDIKELDLKSLRKYVSLVSQEPILFNCTIRENILIGKKDGTEEDIVLAAIEAEAHDYISMLPDKYDTWVGVKGSQLSGGQKQRIAIARAIIKNPKILLLDEATSALDMNTEKKIQLTLDSVMENKTTIIVAQRLSTVKKAKHIIVVETGKIAEAGTYDELVESGGFFSRLLDIQKKIEADAKEEKEAASSEKESKEGKSQPETVVERPGEVVSRVVTILKTYWGWISFSCVAALISGLVFPTFTYFLAEDLLTLLGYNGSDKIDETRTNFIWMSALSVVILLGLLGMIGAIYRVTALFTYDLRYQSIYALLYYDQKFYDKPESSPGAMSYRLGHDTEKLSGVAGPAFGLQVMLIASMFTAIIIAFIENAVFTLTVLPFLPIIIASSAKSVELTTDGLVTNNLKNTTAIASDALSNIKTVNSFNCQKYFYKRYIAASTSESKEVFKASHLSGVFFGMRYILNYLMWGNMSWIGGYMVYKDDLTVEEMIVSYFCILYSYVGFIILGAFAPDVDGAIKSASKLFTMMDYKPEINANVPLDSSEYIKGNIEFENVNFKYEGRDVMVLNKLNFSLKAGSTLGVTGTTGSGKSTIAQLLLRFYNPTGGEIYIDGRPINSINLPSLRNAICWVGQEPILFKGSVFYNLQLGNTEVTVEEAHVALKKAQASDIIEKYGIDHDVGFRGNFLSGGQKQRIAIARALVRKPVVLILDESTSALDNITEKNLQVALNEEKLTIISIAHRLQTIQEYDQILMLEKGTVVERGTHEELMAIPNGFYLRLYKSS